MAVLPIVRMGNPVLRTPAAPVPLAALAEPATQQWIDDMIETMHDADGVGLAAPQVGDLIRNPAVHAEEEPHHESEREGEDVDWEDCLSIPDLRGLVPRHPALRLCGLDRHGAAFERVVEGFEARIVQHEFDHLNGVLFLDRMRDLASLAFLDEWQEYMQDPAESDRPAAADKAE